MLLTDKEIMQYGETLLKPFRENCVTNIGYDLTTECFATEKSRILKEIDLEPGASVFVRTEEEICLPNDMIAVVQLRNSRIRMGLDLTAPVYQPGHKTKLFFRVTNISVNRIHLSAGEKGGIAYLLFVRLGTEVRNPYNGTFQNEFDYIDLGDYRSVYEREITKVEKKVEDIKEIEKSIYGNVLSIMGIFIGIFSLINVNLSLVQAQTGMDTLLTFNFATVGAIAFLIGLISTILPNGQNRRPVWLASGVAFAMAIMTQLFL